MTDDLRVALIEQIQQLGFTLRFPGPANWHDTTVSSITLWAERVVVVAPALSSTEQVEVLASVLDEIQG